MRTYTGQPQVHLKLCHPTNIGHNENLIVTILMATYAQFLHCHDNTYWWEACQMNGAGRNYSLTKHDCNDNNNFTIMIVICTKFYQCHVDTYRWETCTTIAGLRDYLFNRHTCLWFISTGLMPTSSVSSLPCDWLIDWLDRVWCPMSILAWDADVDMG